jgi:hypothetical protein
VAGGNMQLQMYVKIYLEKYVDLIKEEEKYYHMQFGNKDKFSNFRREFEFDIISKRLRPKIIACSEFTQICSSIDILSDGDML